MKAWLIAVTFIAAASACSPSSDNQSSAHVALVKTAQAQRGNVAPQLRLYGAADAGTLARRDLTALGESVVTQILAQPGQFVRSGTPIVRLRPSPVSELDLARARSDAMAATSALARMRRLKADGLVSNGDVETASAASRTAQATVTSLSARSGSGLLRAPADGIVSTISASPGAVVAAGVSVATLTPAESRRARFGMDPEEARLMRPGMPIRIRPASGSPFTSSIDSVDLSVDATTRLSSLYARIPADARVGAGEPLVGEVSVPGASAGTIVPYSAILDDAGQPFVFVVQNGTAYRRNVKLGTTSSTQASVIGGLRAGEIVVTEGGTALEDGVKVRLR